MRLTRSALSLPALGAAVALAVSSCSASTDSALSGTVVSSSASASASASASPSSSSSAASAIFPTASASPSASTSASASASSPAPAPSVVTITVNPEPSVTTVPAKSDSSGDKKSSSCSNVSASSTVSKALSDMKNKSKWNQWTNVSRTYEGFDPCAELSWIDAIPGSSPDECCISSMAHHILLFHYGKFIGTATYEPYSFSPSITRTADNSISVTYRYMKDDESPANASGRTTATFTWSSSQNKVVMSGEVPPSGE